MYDKNSNKQTKEINVLGFGPIQLPVYQEDRSPKMRAIKRKSNLLDTIVSAKAVIKKLLKNK